jgi:hypothetical protein
MQDSAEYPEKHSKTTTKRCICCIIQKIGSKVPVYLEFAYSLVVNFSLECMSILKD